MESRTRSTNHKSSSSSKHGFDAGSNKGETIRSNGERGNRKLATNPNGSG